MAAAAARRRLGFYLPRWPSAPRRQPFLWRPACSAASAGRARREMARIGLRHIRKWYAIHLNPCAYLIARPLTHCSSTACSLWAAVSKADEIKEE